MVTVSRIGPITKAAGFTIFTIEIECNIIYPVKVDADEFNE
jgi:hypothetical protein